MYIYEILVIEFDELGSVVHVSNIREFKFDFRYQYRYILTTCHAHALCSQEERGQVYWKSPLPKSALYWKSGEL